MADAATMEFTDTNFEGEVLQSSQPVLVDFWAEWCQPCKMLTPTIDELARDFQGRAKVGKVDTDENKNTAFKYGIQSIPTVMIFKGGEVIKRFVGFTNKNDLRSAIESAL